MKTNKTVTVIGGGIAGLAAATQLAEAGFLVTVLEKRSILGGRASSSMNPENGDWIDNCQHVLLNCCNALMRFYKKLGVDSKITFHDQYVFIDPEGTISHLKGSRLPSPLHLMHSFLKLKFLGMKDKLGIFRAMLLMALSSKEKMEALEKVSFEHWLKSHEQTPLAIDRFWKVILVSALNEDLDKISAKYAFKTFKEAFLKGNRAYWMGIPNVPLSEIYSKPSIEYLEKRAGKISFQKKVNRFEIEEGRIKKLILSDGLSSTSDYYISALPFDELLEALPKEMIQKTDFFNKLKSLEVSPITGVHLFFDRPVTELEHAVLLDRKIQWVFNKSKNFGKTWEKNGQYLQVVISASRDFIPLSKKEAVELTLKELKEFFPKIGEAKLQRSAVIKEVRATFSPQPGTDQLRPSHRSPIPNLWIVGDWTKTDWPATMESAVRSGDAAAQEIMKEEGL
jgi:zeta-carotene desaturase